MVVWLGQSDDIRLFGGKSAQLSRLFTRYPIPPGFCLSVAAFEEWVALSCPDYLPSVWQTAIGEAYQQLAETMQLDQPPVAVRSSAVDEDGQTASFAGQYESYLNVMGVEALATAVLACWHSAFAERVKVYRQGGHAPLAVLVQLMVPADMALVAFSRNPINQQAEVVINATWGLGQSLVDGSTTPDTYIVRPSDQALLQRQIGAKPTMTVRLPTGVKQVPTPRPMQRLAVLAEPQIKEVAQLAVQLESDMGWPIDLEAAYYQNKLYLLQCRPITT